MNDDREIRQRRARGRRLALTLAVIAVLVYVGFMFLTHMRG